MKAGIYIHIPFCKSRCSYCDFATDVYRDRESVERYVTGILSELDRTAFNGIEADTIYFGGGTPSLLNPAQLSQIAERIQSVFDIDSDFEFTVEMNPATVTTEKLREFRSIGVNRASFGVQTFDDRALKLLARGHDAEDARRTFKMLREAGFENISFDLIAGLPGQTIDNWKKNLSEALSMNPEHLSLYLLEIHSGTPLEEQIRSGRQPEPDDDTSAEMYRLIQETAESTEYRQYEISNFAKPGFESKHNNKYWKLEPVIGFGVSAHSFDGVGRRWSNERKTEAYLKAIESGTDPVVHAEDLDGKQLSAEFGFLSLRLQEGLNLEQYRSRFDKDLLEEYRDDLARLEKLGFIAISDKSVVLTKKGMLFSNEVFEVFV